MKFGNRLAEEAEPGWRYLDYAGLKQQLKDILHEREEAPASTSTPSSGAPFANKLRSELEEVERFLREQEGQASERLANLRKDLARIEGWIESDFADVEQHLDELQQRFTALGLLVARLLNFVDLNVTAARKILKKYDHVTGHHAGPSMLLGRDGAQLERLSDPFELSEMTVSVQECVERIVLLRRKGPGRLLQSSEEDLISQALAMTDDEEDAQMGFETFLAKQLLVSQRSHIKVAHAADLEASRSARREPRSSRFGDILDESSTGLVFHAALVTFVIALYSCNEGALAPFSELYAEAAGGPADTTAFAFAVRVASAWLMSFYLINPTTAHLLEPICLACVAVIIANLAYAQVFNVAWVVSPPPEGPAGAESKTINDLVLFSSVAFLGVGAFIPRILPAVVCARPAFARTRRVEPLASSAFVIGLLGRVIGRGVLAISSSLDYTEIHQEVLGFKVNGLSYPALAFGVTWAVLLAVIALPAATSYGLRLVAQLRAPRGSSALATHDGGAQRLDGEAQTKGGVYSTSRATGGVIARRPPTPRLLRQVSGQVDPFESGVFRQRLRGMSWFTIFALQSAMSFTLALVEACLLYILSSVFLFSWPLLTIIALLWTTLPVVMLPLSWLILRGLGSWFTLRLGAAFAAITACFLMPLGRIGATYSLSWFLSLSVVLAVVVVLLECGVAVAASRTMELWPKERPLRRYGIAGAAMAVQACRFAGELGTFALLAGALAYGQTDPAFVLNVGYSAVAILQTLCFFFLLWEDK